MSPKIKKYLSATALLIGLAYPFLVYFGISLFSPQILVGIILFMLSLRVLIMKNTLPAGYRLIWPMVVAICVMGAMALLQVTVAVKLYPVAISLLLGAAFLWSLVNPPTVIEMIARLTEPDLDEKGISYTRKVTIVWICFFVFNATIAGLSVVYGTIEQWTLYNGFISYCLMGMLFAGEFLIRRNMRARG